MIGCVLGTLGIIALAKMARARRYGCFAGPCGGGGGCWWRHHHHGFGGFPHRDWHRGRWGNGPGYGQGQDSGEGGDGEGPDDFGPGSGGGGFGGRMFLRGALEPLEMTPAQERVVFAAVDEMREAASKLRGEMRASRKDVAGSFRKPVHDEVLFGELYARHDRAIEDLRRTFVGATAKVHEALDEKQRTRLADIIESGPRFFGRGLGRGFGRRHGSW
ncbi:MAG TPA: hypothetical protein VH374_15855 [Polyangia bacterium]|nr:hypothetical protein [Polyangia bacterium]